MKSTQLPLIKAIVDQMIGVCRELAGKSASDPVPVILRVSKGSGDFRCIQLVTTVGTVTILDDNKLTELDYPVADIGVTSNWTKVSKGMIITKDAPIIVPVDRASRVAMFADPEIDVAVSLLHSNSVLPPTSVLFNPGNSVVLSHAGGKALTWAYDPAGQSPRSTDPYTNLSSMWTTNPLSCEDGLYGVVRAWHRAVAYSFPKDPCTGQPTKLDGVAFSRIGGHAGVRLVSRELGIVVSMACSRLPEKYSTISYLDSNNHLVVCDINDNYTYNVRGQNNKEVNDMEVKMIDIAQVRTKVAAAPQSLATPTETKAEPTVAAMNTTPAPAAVAVAPAPEAKPSDTVVAAEVEKVATPVDTQPAPQEPVKTAEEILQEAITLCSEVSVVIKSVQSAVRSAIKTHKQEIKELKSNVKESEELVKLRSAHKRLKTLLLEADV